MAKKIMFQGTSSNVGKSILCTEWVIKQYHLKHKIWP